MGKAPRTATPKSDPTRVSVQVRVFSGIVVGAVLPLCFRLWSGAWPSIAAGWWCWAASVVIALVAVALSPVLIVMYRYAGILSSVNSPSFRLSTYNMWTEVTHVEDAGATQIMRMEDENFILLSVGITTAKIFTCVALDDPTGFIELATIPLDNPDTRLDASRQDRQKEDEQFLFRIRTEIGWPKWVSELREVVQKLLEAA